MIRAAWSKDDRWALAIALLCGLITGMIFIYLVPPWQHYDEPNHFEYAWLVANRLRLPQPGDYDAGMRIDVARSMLENGFFKGMAIRPDLTPSDQPAWIGIYSQLNDPPLYYVLAAVPLRLMSNFSVQDQLYAARMFSLALYLVSILAAYGVICELTPAGHALRLYVPLGMVFLPGLADIMTAMNNDVGAIAFFSLFVWGSVRLLRCGFSPGVLLGTAAAVVLGVLTKETTYISVPLLAVVVLFSVLRGRYRWAAWALAAAAVLAALVAVFGWGDAASWVRRSFQQQPTRIAHREAAAGEYALVVEVSPSTNPQELNRIYQLLPPADAQTMQGKTITLGAWVWADRPVEVRTPTLHLYESNEDLFRRISVGVEPSFFAFTETITAPSWRAWIELSPLPAAGAAPLAVYYDGVVLVEGEYSLEKRPQFDDPRASTGIWAGKPFENLVRNASAETGGLRVRLWADRLGAAFLPDRTRPSWIAGVLLDLRGAGWFHKDLSVHMLRSFWGRFGWGHVLMLGSRPYRFLAALTALAVVGAGIFWFRRRRSLSPEMLFFLGLTVAAAWVLTLVRSENYVLLRIFYPPARYAYPAIIPTLILLHAGWSEIYRPISRRLPRRLGTAVYAILIAAPLLWALLSIGVFYHG